VQREAAPDTQKAGPEDVAYWDDVFRLARKRIVAKQFAEAEKLLRSVYEDPKFTTADSPGVVLNLGLCRQAQGDFAEAMSLYLESMASPVWTGEDRKELLEALRSARLGHAPRESGGEAVTADSADEAYWDDAFRLARKRIAANQFAEAEKLLRQIYEDPKFRTADSPGVALNLGLCRQEQGDFAGAISLYEESLASPNRDEEKRRRILELIRTARLKQRAPT
jgi:Tfp pilus assembly protein PilF